MVKETKRIFKVGTNVGGFIAKTATKSLLGISNKNIPVELTELLGNLKGPIMKVAQILSTIPDALPKEYAQQLSKLQAEAPSMNWLFVKRRMKNELGYNWENNFKEFQKTANKAASLGQVHKAVLNEERKIVACKLQYPDMEAAIKADLKQLKLILKIYKQIDNSILTDDIFNELTERLIEEVDNVSSISLSVVGESFGEVPDIFDIYKTKFEQNNNYYNKLNVKHWGYVESKEKYCNILKDADIVVSTANHEFYGVSVLEAVLHNCFPLVPNRLVYPEIYNKIHDSIQW